MYFPSPWLGPNAQSVLRPSCLLPSIPSPCTVNGSSLHPSHPFLLRLAIWPSTGMRSRRIWLTLVSRLPRSELSFAGQLLHNVALGVHPLFDARKANWHAGLRRVYGHSPPPFHAGVLKYKNVPGIPVNTASISPARALSYEIARADSRSSRSSPYYSLLINRIPPIIKGKAPWLIVLIPSNPSGSVS